MIVLVKFLNSCPFTTYTYMYTLLNCHLQQSTKDYCGIIYIRKDKCSWIFKKYDALLCYTRYVREGRPLEAKVTQEIEIYEH